MFWADKIAEKIIKSGKYQPYWVDDMKTPSGRIHVGSLRGVVIHDLIHQALKSRGKKVKFTYVFDDHDPMDGLPVYLEKEKWQKYMGQPLFTIPSPEPGKANNFAEYFALEFKEVFNKIGSYPDIIWASNLYKNGKMNADIKLCLDRVAIIRQIYTETYKKPVPVNWYPFQVNCPRCGKESTTRVRHWDGELVHFECQVNAVAWTQGCGYEGKISPFSTDGIYRGKLSWKVEWAVKWKVIGVTIEGAGKDHMTAGGSHDISRQICEKVIDYPTPYPLAYEHFLIGGKKMSSSKGLGASAKEMSEVLPPYLLRFLFVRTDYRQAIDFDPVNTLAIPELFDEYDRCWQAFIDDSNHDLARVFELAQIDQAPKKKQIFLPRFRDVVNYMQLPNVNLVKKFAEIKREPLNETENRILAERTEYAQKWLKNYAPEEFRFHMTDQLPDKAKDLSRNQREFLGQIRNLIEKYSDPEALQAELYKTAKSLKIPVKEAFATIYIVFLGKTHGPRAAWFLLQYPKEQVLQRLHESVNYTTKKSPLNQKVSERNR